MKRDLTMRLIKQIKNEIKEARKFRRLTWREKLYVGIGALLCCWLFDHFGRFELALPTMNCIGVLGILIALKWKLRQYTWFWITMIIIAALHAYLLLLIPWTTNWVPAMAIAGIDSIDLVVILTILTIVGNFLEGQKPLKDERPR
jgi:hypothetical protein